MRHYSIVCLAFVAIFFVANVAMVYAQYLPPSSHNQQAQQSSSSHRIRQHPLPQPAPQFQIGPIKSSVPIASFRIVNKSELGQINSAQPSINSAPTNQRDEHFQSFAKQNQESSAYNELNTLSTYDGSQGPSNTIQQLVSPGQKQQNVHGSAIAEHVFQNTQHNNEEIAAVQNLRQQNFEHSNYLPPTPVSNSFADQNSDQPGASFSAHEHGQPYSIPNTIQYQHQFTIPTAFQAGPNYFSQDQIQKYLTLSQSDHNNVANRLGIFSASDATYTAPDSQTYQATPLAVTSPQSFSASANSAVQIYTQASLKGQAYLPPGPSTQINHVLDASPSPFSSNKPAFIQQLYSSTLPAPAPRSLFDPESKNVHQELNTTPESISKAYLPPALPENFDNFKSHDSFLQAPLQYRRNTGSTNAASIQHHNSNPASISQSYFPAALHGESHNDVYPVSPGEGSDQASEQPQLNSRLESISKLHLPATLQVELNNNNSPRSSSSTQYQFTVQHQHNSNPASISQSYLSTALQKELHNNATPATSSPAFTQYQHNVIPASEQSQHNRSPASISQSHLPSTLQAEFRNSNSSASALSSHVQYHQNVVGVNADSGQFQHNSSPAFISQTYLPSAVREELHNNNSPVFSTSVPAEYQQNTAGSNRASVQPHHNSSPASSPAPAEFHRPVSIDVSTQYQQNTAVTNSASVQSQHSIKHSVPIPLVPFSRPPQNIYNLTDINIPMSQYQGNIRYSQPTPLTLFPPKKHIPQESLHHNVESRSLSETATPEKNDEATQQIPSGFDIVYIGSDSSLDNPETELLSETSPIEIHAQNGQTVYGSNGGYVY